MVLHEGVGSQLGWVGLVVGTRCGIKAERTEGEGDFNERTGTVVSILTSHLKQL